jgi:hypothetical protein
LRENRRFGRWRWWKEERAALGEETMREEECAGRGDGTRRGLHWERRWREEHRFERGG